MKKLVKTLFVAASMSAMTMSVVAADTAPLTLYNFETGVQQSIDPRELTAESALSFLPDIPESESLLNHYLEKNEGIAFLALIESYADIIRIVQELPQTQ